MLQLCKFFEKVDTKNKYRLVNISKIHLKCTQRQINSYLEFIVSIIQWGFTQGESAQHCLLVMIE